MELSEARELLYKYLDIRDGYRQGIQKTLLVEVGEWEQAVLAAMVTPKMEPALGQMEPELQRCLSRLDDEVVGYQRAMDRYANELIGRIKAASETDSAFDAPTLRWQGWTRDVYEQMLGNMHRAEKGEQVLRDRVERLEADMNKLLNALRKAGGL